MKEREWWARVIRPELHHPERGMIARKYEDKFLPGTLDTFLAHRGRSAWCELKLIKEWPKRIDTPVRVPWSPEQIRTGVEFYGAGIQVIGLTGIDATNEWFVHDFEDLRGVGFALPQQQLRDLAFLRGRWGHAATQAESAMMIMQWLGTE